MRRALHPGPRVKCPTEICTTLLSLVESPPFHSTSVSSLLSLTILAFPQFSGISAIPGDDGRFHGGLVITRTEITCSVCQAGSVKQIEYLKTQWSFFSQQLAPSAAAIEPPTSTAGGVSVWVQRQCFR